MPKEDKVATVVAQVGMVVVKDTVAVEATVVDNRAMEVVRAMVVVKATVADKATVVDTRVEAEAIISQQMEMAFLEHQLTLITPDQPTQRQYLWATLVSTDPRVRLMISSIKKDSMCLK